MNNSLEPIINTPSHFCAIFLAIILPTIIVLVILYIIIAGIADTFQNKSVSRLSNSITTKPNTHAMPTVTTKTDHLTPNYQTDAIGLATIVNDFVTDKTLVAGIQIGETCHILAKKSIKKDDTATQQQQQLQNALTIVRDAAKTSNVRSLELVFTDPIIKDYATNLQKDSRIAMQYAQEINALSKQIDIIFTNINTVPANKIAKLNHYVTEH